MDKRQDTLIKALRETDEDISKAAAEALEKLRLREKLDFLTKKIDSGDMLEKIKAVYAVADIKGDKVLELLLRAAKDPSEDVRAAVARVLGTCADQRAMPVLLEMLKDASPMVLRSAVESCVKYNDVRFLGQFMQLLKNQDSGVVERTLEAVARLGDKRAEEAMLYFAVKGNKNMRLIALKALGEMDR